MVKIKILSLILVSFFIGYQAHKADLFPLSDFFDRMKEEKVPDTALKYSVFHDLENKKEVECPSAQDTLVIAGFGQSNSANRGGHRFENTNAKVLNFYNGKCYIANDPMLGTSGGFGSLWIPFAKALNTNKTILLVTFGVNSSKVKNWLAEDGLWSHYKTNMASLTEVGLAPQYFVWMQGESDTETELNEFNQDLNQFFRQIKLDFPESRIALSGTTYCNGEAPTIVEEQQKVANDNGYIWLGVTDKYKKARYRYDGCHLSEQGMRSIAKMFAAKINENLR